METLIMEQLRKEQNEILGLRLRLQKAEKDGLSG